MYIGSIKSPKPASVQPCKGVFILPRHITLGRRRIKSRDDMWRRPYVPAKCSADNPLMLLDLRRLKGTCAHQRFYFLHTTWHLLHSPNEMKSTGTEVPGFARPCCNTTAAWVNSPLCLLHPWNSNTKTYLIFSMESPESCGLPSRWISSPRRFYLDPLRLSRAELCLWALWLGPKPLPHSGLLFWLSAIPRIQILHLAWQSRRRFSCLSSSVKM